MRGIDTIKLLREDHFWIFKISGFKLLDKLGLPRSCF